MPPHCDSVDGPVVRAARNALEAGNVNLVLPYVPEQAEGELGQAFEKTLRAREEGAEAMEVADRWFFETAVRLHRQGEGVPFSGLKPAGLDVGPVVPRAEKALETGDPKDLIDFLSAIVEDNIVERFQEAMSKKLYDVDDVDMAREHVEAELGMILFCHHLYHFIEEREAHGHRGGRRSRAA